MLEGRIVLPGKSRLQPPKEKGRIGQVNQQVLVGNRRLSYLKKGYFQDSDKGGKRRLEQGTGRDFKGQGGNL